MLTSPQLTSRRYAGSQGMSGSFIAKMATLMYLLEISMLSGSGLRDAKWKPSSEGVGLSCALPRGLGAGVESWRSTKSQASKKINIERIGLSAWNAFGIQRLVDRLVWPSLPICLAFEMAFLLVKFLRHCGNPWQGGEKDVSLICLVL